MRVALVVVPVTVVAVTVLAKVPLKMIAIMMTGMLAIMVMAKRKQLCNYRYGGSSQTAPITWWVAVTTVFVNAALVLEASSRGPHALWRSS